MKYTFVKNYMNDSLYQVHPTRLDMEDKSLGGCLRTVMMARSNTIRVDGFGWEELNFIINSIVCQ